MRSENAWVWLAAGVMALGLNGMYQDGQLGWAHSEACRAEQYADQVAARGLQYVAMAEVMLGRSAESFGRTEAALQRFQGKALCQRTAMAQQEMAMAQTRERMIEAQVQRQIDMAQLKMDKAGMVKIQKADLYRDCPFSKLVVKVPDVKADLSGLPEVQVPDIPEIPQVRVSVSHDPI
jgi:hypothetical protein